MSVLGYRVRRPKRYRKAGRPAPRLQSGPRIHGTTLQYRSTNPYGGTCPSAGSMSLHATDGGGPIRRPRHAPRRPRGLFQEPHLGRIPFDRPPSATRWRSNAMIPDHEKRSAQGIGICRRRRTTRSSSAGIPKGHSVRVHPCLHLRPLRPGQTRHPYRENPGRTWRGNSVPRRKGDLPCLQHIPEFCLKPSFPELAPTGRKCRRDLRLILNVTGISILPAYLQTPEHKSLPDFCVACQRCGDQP